MAERRVPEAVLDLREFFARDAHLSPEQLADYRQRLATYAAQGSQPMQPALNLEAAPCA